MFEIVEVSAWQLIVGLLLMGVAGIILGHERGYLQGYREAAKLSEERHEEDLRDIWRALDKRALDTVRHRGG
jgi:hypothetical protein